MTQSKSHRWGVLALAMVLVASGLAVSGCDNDRDNPPKNPDAPPPATPAPVPRAK